MYGGPTVKGPNDTRDYQAAQLANGLRVLVVSDPDATAAAAALSVHAGFYLDPDELPGLAHFCEHMLFLGTEEFPQENSLRLFLAANGGSQNAFTTEQDTTYYFDVSPAILQESLVRFSSFFKTPLFTPSATMRELAAIEAEDAKNRQSDAFRLNQLAKSFAAQGHPQRRFGTGNSKTLWQEPQRKGINTRAALLDFFARYYDASLMTLCVVGRESTGTLLRWAEDSFGPVVGRGLPSPGFPWRGENPFPPNVIRGEQQIVQAVPVALRRVLSASWPVVFQDDEGRSEWLRCKPAGYISFLLGHEGEGSLLSILKGRGWATGVSAGVVREDDNFAMLQVKFQLTESGLQEREVVLAALYAVIRRLRSGVPQYIFEEQASLAEMRWRFQPKVGSDALAVLLAQQMQKGYSPEEYLSGRALYYQPRTGKTVQQVVAALLAQMTPERAQYSAVSRSFVAEAQLTEKWFGTKYSLAPISSEALRLWRSGPPPVGYDIPKPNAFVPLDFRLKATQAFATDRPEAIAEPPALLVDGQRLRAFFKPDRAFAVPRAAVQLFLCLPDDGSTGSDDVAARIWLLSLRDRLTETFYDARYAGLNFEVEITAEGLKLDFGGYSDRLVLLVEEVLQRLRGFDGPSQGEFERALDGVLREQDSFSKQQPYKYAAYCARLATASLYPSIGELRRQAAAVTREQARAYGAKFSSASQRLFAQVLLQGNLDTADAGRVLRALRQLPFQALERSKSRRVRFAELPVGKDVLVLSGASNPAEMNHALQCLFFIGPTDEEWIMTLLLQIIIEGPFFNKLRTEQQLGYVVLSGTDRAGLVARLSLTVQSSAKAPSALLSAVDGCLKSFRVLLETMAPRDFTRFKISLVERIVKPDERLGEECARWWDEIASFQYGWRRRSEEASLVAGITSGRLLDFFDRHVAVDAPERRRLDVAVFAGGLGMEESMGEMRADATRRGSILIRDPSAFRSSLSTWPVVYRTPTDSL